ncbi:restriction endonuclease subunit S [Bittarella massiliensis (ex Durand et al. 2017)]|uniref:restriction endonuclease subunit S n=1 Tax=Bittarella massiliensis (ex Durand et al. 2017) TaxID=1720313 RepID=UPI001A9BD1F9|nr:restriction endonuclease subunit S [Bittarella massiliensis (ex Durand et al. 2017)]
MVTFNPKLSLPKGSFAKKVAMEHLSPHTKYVTKFELSSYTGGAKFMNGDTLLARITPCLENGKTSQVTLLNEGEIGFGSTEFIVLRAKDGIADKDFIYYLATSSQFRDYAIKSMVGSSGRQRVQQDVLENMYIDCPSIPEQKAIAAVLSALDDKIELNNRINKNLEAQAQAIFKSWFVDFEPFRDGEFVDSELGPIPKGWRVGQLSEIGTIVGGATPSKSKDEYYIESNRGIAWITPKDLSINKNKFISHGKIDITDLGYRNASTKLMPAGSVLFSSRAPIGYMAIADNELCTNQGFKSIIPEKVIGTSFVYYTLKFNLDTIQNLGSGSTFKEVSGSVMKSLNVLIPDLHIVNKFDKVCKPLLSKQKSLEYQSQTLVAIRDTLLPKLMSGEIRVPLEV